MTGFVNLCEKWRDLQIRFQCYLFTYFLFKRDARVNLLEDYLLYNPLKNGNLYIPFPVKADVIILREMFKL